MQVAATRATVKGHGLAVGDKVNFHGMASDSFPASEPTLCILTKEGAKYTLTSVEPSHTGTPWVWTFGAAAQVWVSVVESVEVTEHDVNGVTVYSGKCAHGWETGLYADRDDAIMVAAGHGEVSRPLYTAPKLAEWECELTDWERELAARPATNVLDAPMILKVIAQPVDPDACVKHPGGYNIPGVAVCIGCEADGTQTMEGPVTLELGDKVLDTTTGVTHRVTRTDEFWVGLFPNRSVRTSDFWVHVGDGAFVIVKPGRDDLSIPTNTPEVDGYFWQRHTVPGQNVSATSTYQLIKDGTTCQVAATVTYTRDGLWKATGCVWMSTGLTEGYWQGESLADAFTHVEQYMTWVTSVRGAGLTWTDIVKLDWRTPYVRTPQAGDMVYRERDGAQGIVRDVLVSGELDLSFPGGAGLIRTPGELISEGFEIISASEIPTGEAVAMAPVRRVLATVTLEISKPLARVKPPIRTNLAKRARKAAKRKSHAFAGKR